MQPLDKSTFLAFESAMDAASDAMEEVELERAGPFYAEFFD
jgi:hypothetical protein